MINQKRNTAFLIIMLSIILMIVVTTGVMFIINKVDNKKTTKLTNNICDINLKYMPTGDKTNSEELKLSSEENTKLNEILNKLEFSKSSKNISNPKYIINFCDTELIIGENEEVIKNNENVKISKGYDNIINFMKKQEEKLNKVYLYKFDNLQISSSSKDNVTKLELSDEDKNKIRELWNNQEKNVEYIYLAIKEEYKLIIDNESLIISDETSYAKYKDGYVLLSQEIINTINKYNKSEIKQVKYAINNDLPYYNERYKERGVTYDTLNTPNAPSYYFISSGEKSSGGYSISIKEVIVNNDGNVEVIIEESSPSPDEFTTLAFTYPVCCIEFESYQSNIVFKTENGETFKRLNF